MNNFNSNNRDFFEAYTKAKQEQKLKRRQLKPYRKHRKLKKFLIITLIILTVISISFFAIFNYFFGNFKTNVNFEKSCENLGVDTMEKIDKNVINIALFGVDKRKEDKNGRSDATLITTFDGVHKKIKITTLLRDSRVKIAGHGQDKLCHAFSYGGANLAVKTINQNFNLDIHDYVKVNFSQMTDVIDALGGLDVELLRAEVNSINGLLNSTPGFEKCPRVKPFYSPKQIVHLNGAQVLQYSRIRDIDSDIIRAERQQYVLNLIFEKLKKLEKMKYPNLIKTMLEIIDTSLNFNDILNLLPFLIKLKSNSIEKCKIPDPNDTQNVKPGKINGTWYWNSNLEKVTTQLHKFLYEKEKTINKKYPKKNLN